MKRIILLSFITTMYIGSYSQVQYTPITPTLVISGTGKTKNLDSVKLHLAHPLGTVLGTDSALHLWHHDTPAPAANDVGIDCRGMLIECLEMTGQPTVGYAAIDSGVMINNVAGTWTKPKYERLAIDGIPDNWDGKTDKYLGVRFLRGSDLYYGWIKMSIDNPASKLEIKGYAFEKTKAKGIIAGDKGTGSGTSVNEISQLNVQSQVHNKIVTFSNIQEKYSVSILDMNGRVLHKGIVDEHNTTVNLQFMPAGMYVGCLQTQSQAASFKFVLQ